MSQKTNEPLVSEEFNPAAKLFITAQDFWDKHKNLAVGIFVIIGVVVLAIGTWTYTQEQKNRAASAAYLTAISADSATYAQSLTNVYTEHEGTEYGYQSAYLLAQDFLNKGDADNALAWFDKALKSSDKGRIITAEALEGKGVAQEIKGDIAAAKSLYQQVIDLAGSHRSNAARLKLSYLLIKEGDVAGAKTNCEAVVADTTADDKYVTAANELLASLTVK